jgi:hypothetical protein
VKLVIADDGGHIFDCPGCGHHHLVPDRWDFDGDLESPTFSPSILIRYPTGEERTPVVCHSFIRRGKIEFLADCTHELAGRTVDLEPPNWGTLDPGGDDA